VHQGAAEKYFLQSLRKATATHHIASATCVRSREVVLELFPDTLTFQHFTKYWGDMCDKPYWACDKPDGIPFPEHVLRFNGGKDIIVFHADWIDQESAVKLPSKEARFFLFTPPDLKSVYLLVLV
jgi:hypothetical protein